MSKTTKISVGLTLFTVILAFVVVVLGAYTRLTDAGLGCPDWPGCYNQLVAPHTTTEIQQAMQAYPHSPVQVSKAWTEMLHRYVAGALGILIVLLGFLAIRKRHVPGQKVLTPILLIGLVIFQALLGMWTVTMKLLPIVVMAHLMGGLTILALLWWFNLKTGDYFHGSSDLKVKRFKPWAILGLVIVLIQIALGGWTSANYAALVCPNFPFCSAHQFFPQSDFQSAFNIFNLFNSSASHLSHAALISIQMTHRIGALVTGVYLGLLSLCLIFLKQNPLLRKLGVITLLILVTQICLGVLNVEWLLPLSVAVLHNIVAVLLLLTMVTFVYLTTKSDHIFHG